MTMMTTDTCSDAHDAHTTLATTSRLTHRYKIEDKIWKVGGGGGGGEGGANAPMISSKGINSFRILRIIRRIVSTVSVRVAMESETTRKVRTPVSG